MELLDCPACAGPDNAECDTCNGMSLVTTEVSDAFLQEQERRAQLQVFKQAAAGAIMEAESVEAVKAAAAAVAEAPTTA